MAELKIDLYTEITCPWCIIGQFRLDKALSKRFPELEFDIEHHPVILLPTCPPQGILIVDLLRSRYGVTDPNAAWARPHAEARASGLALDLSRQGYAYPTERAHTLIRHARAFGTQHLLAAALAAAYFHEGHNISDAQFLAELAKEYGFKKSDALQIVLDPAEIAATQREAANAASIGIRSVPHFAFGTQISLNGGRSEDELERGLRAALEIAAA